jgi:hypothetical protein
MNGCFVQVQKSETGPTHASNDFRIVEGLSAFYALILLISASYIGFTDARAG